MRKIKGLAVLVCFLMVLLSVQPYSFAAGKALTNEVNTSSDDAPLSHVEPINGLVDEVKSIPDVRPVTQLERQVDVSTGEIPEIKEYTEQGNYRYTGSVPVVGTRANYYLADVNTQFQDIVASGDSTFYLVTLPTDGKLSVELTGVSGVDNDLYVVSTSGVILVGSENAAGASEYVYTIQTAGQYYILVNNYSGSSTTPFWLTIFHTSNHDNGELNDYSYQAVSGAQYFRTSWNLDSYIDEDWVTFTVPDSRNVLLDFASNDTSYAAIVYKVENGALVNKVLFHPSQSTTCEHYHMFSYGAGQYYIRVLSLDYSYGSDYVLTLNARHSDVAILLHHGIDLQSLVYLTDVSHGSIAVDGKLLGPFEWSFEHRYDQGPYSNTVIEISAKAARRYEVDSVSPVYLPTRTVSVRVLDVRYSYYKSVIASGNVLERIDIDINTATAFPNGQPEMYLTFDIDTGECIAFNMPGFDPYNPTNI